MAESHPSRVRGLKFIDETGMGGLYGSHPSRVRGLKFCQLARPLYALLVASFTGAWIEIRGFGMNEASDIVASFTGAWIEICKEL